MHHFPHDENADVVRGLLRLRFVLLRNGMPAPQLVAESLLRAVEGRLHERADAGELLEAVRPVLGEVDHLLVRCFGRGGVARVGADGVQRRRPVFLGRVEAVFGCVGGVGHAADGPHVLGKVFPDVLEDAGLVHSAGCKDAVEVQQLGKFDGTVRLDPRLGGAEAVVGFAPGLLLVAVPAGVGADDAVAPRQQAEHEEVEASKEHAEPVGAVLLAERVGIGNVLDAEEVLEQVKERFELAIGETEELAHHRGEKVRALVDGWSARLSAVLPGWESFREFANALEAEHRFVAEEVVVAAPPDALEHVPERPRVEAALTRKAESLGREYHFDGAVGHSLSLARMEWRCSAIPSSNCFNSEGGIYATTEFPVNAIRPLVPPMDEGFFPL